MSSAICYHVDNSTCGEAEYHADTDYLDDNWVSRAWDFKFGSPLWSANTPPIFRADDMPWDMTFDADQNSFDPYRKGGANPDKARTDQMTSEDEHAI